MHRTPLDAWLARNASARALLAFFRDATSATAVQAVWTFRGRFSASTVRHAVAILALAGRLVQLGKEIRWPGKRPAQVWRAT